MYSYLLLIIALACLSIGCTSNDKTIVVGKPTELPYTYTWQPTTVPLRHVNFVNEQIGWAVGMEGAVYSTTDGGANWQRLDVGVDEALNHIHFIDPQHGWIVGGDYFVSDDAIALATSDGGKTWRQQAPGLNGALMSVHFINRLRGWSTAENGEILETRDGGRNWRRSKIPNSWMDPCSCITFSDPKHGWIVGGHNLPQGGRSVIWATNDGGISWEKQRGRVNCALRSVAFSDSRHGCAVGAMASIITTDDGGKTWTKRSVELPEHITLHTVSLVDNQFGWAAGDNGVILVTDDGGQNWTLQESGIVASDWITSIQFVNREVGWAVTNNGARITTRDGGRTWLTDCLASTWLLFDVDCVDSDNAWAVGAGGTIVNTHDAGSSWSIQRVAKSASTLHAVDFVDATTGWAVGNDGTILSTRDGGKNWLPYELKVDNREGGTQIPDDRHLHGIHFLNRNEGWIGGESGLLLHTVDGGTTWKQIRTPMVGTIFDLEFEDEYGWAVGEDGAIIFTSNHGKNWREQSSDVRVPLRSVDFFDDRIGYACGDQGTFLSTADGGESWTRQRMASNATLSHVTFATKSLGWVAASFEIEPTRYRGEILRTTDGGKTWENATPQITRSVNSLSFFSNQSACAVGHGIISGHYAGHAPYVLSISHSKGVLQWTVAPTSLGPATQQVEFRQGENGDWRPISTHEIQQAGTHSFQVAWSPSSAPYEVVPGTKLFYRLALRDEGDAAYLHEIPEGIVYMSWWDRQSRSTLVTIAIVFGGAIWIAICYLLSFLYPASLIFLSNHGPHGRLAEVIKGTEWLQAVVAPAAVFVSVPFSTHRRVRTFCCEILRERSGYLELLPTTLRIAFLKHDDFKTAWADGWIHERTEAARKNYAALETVAKRTTYVPAPIKLDANLHDEVTADLFNAKLNDASQRTLFLIHGEGGSGKTSIACQIGRWALEGELADHVILPVLIEEDLGETPEPASLAQVVQGKVQLLVGDAAPLDEELFEILLRYKRLLVIVDHISELSEETRQRIRPSAHNFRIGAIAFTSRTRDLFRDVPRTLIKPLRIAGDRLSTFMHAYLDCRDKRDLFTDKEFFDACAVLARLVANRDVTVLLATMYLDQVINSRMPSDDDTIPQTIPALMLRYLDSLHARGTSRTQLRLTQQNSKIVAWQCVKRHFQSSVAQRRDVIKELKGGDPEARMSYLEKELRIVRTCGVSHDKIRFELDPLAEYLAAMWIVETYRGHKKNWNVAIQKLLVASQTSKAIDGFVVALRDCCESLEDNNVPDFVTEELAKLCTSTSD